MRLGLHRLMYGLLFPAVLGTLFVLFVNDELVAWHFNQRTFFGIVFITHWCLEFILATQEDYVARYGVVDFAGDLLLIVVMYEAFRALSPIRQAVEPGYQGLYFWVMLIPAAFLAVDVLNRFITGHTLKRAIVAVDVVAFLVTLGFWICACVYAAFRLSPGVAYLYIGLVLLLSVASFVARKGRLQGRAA